jgi:hypothetical protein
VKHGKPTSEQAAIRQALHLWALRGRKGPGLHGKGALFPEARP